MRAQRTLIMTLAMCGAMLATSVVFVASPAGAQSSSISVTPNTGLVDQQVVSVSGQLLESGTYVIGQCALPLPTEAIQALNECSNGNTMPTGTPDNLAFTVRRSVNGTDCAIDACVLAIATVVNFTLIELATQPLSFAADPDVVVTHPQGTGLITPVDLIDGDFLRIDGLALPVGATAEPVQCFADADCISLSEPLTVTDPQQVFVRQRVQRTIPAATGLHDCAGGGCTVGLRLTNLPGDPAGVLVVADSVAFQRMHFTMYGNPDQLVTDGDVVDFRLKNYHAGAAIGVALCAFVHDDLRFVCTLENSAVTQPPALPPTEITVRQTFTASTDGTEVDCSQGGNATCVLLFLALVDGEFIDAFGTRLFYS